MQITWFGQAAFKLEASDGFSVITDPYTPEILGYAPIAETARAVITSSDDDPAHCRADLIPGTPPAVNALAVAQAGGRGEVAGLPLQAIEAAEWAMHPEHPPEKCGMYRFALDGLEIGHMGDVGNPLNAEQTAFLDGLDILLALTGGPPTVSLEEVMRIIRATRPKLVIPMHFRTLAYKPRNIHWVEAFLAHFPEEEIDFAFGPRAEITREGLPATTRVLVLDYLR